MAIWDKVKQSIDKAGKAAQDVFDEGKLRIDAYRARELADKAAETLGYAVFHAAQDFRAAADEDRAAEGGAGDGAGGIERGGAGGVSI